MILIFLSCIFFFSFQNRGFSLMVNRWLLNLPHRHSVNLLVDLAKATKTVNGEHQSHFRWNSDDCFIFLFLLTRIIGRAGFVICFSLPKSFAYVFSFFSNQHESVAIHRGVDHKPSAKSKIVSCVCFCIHGYMLKENCGWCLVWRSIAFWVEKLYRFISWE